MKTTIEILNVKEVKGFIHQNSIYASDPNRYNSSRIVSRSYEPKALFIEALIEGKKKTFYSPTVIVTVTSGWLNHKTMHDNSWFELIEGEQKSFRGDKMFENSDMYPNVALQTKCEIVPKIKIGDILNISYSENGNKINRVKILN